MALEGKNGLMEPTKSRTTEACNSRSSVEGNPILSIILTRETYYRTPFDKLPKVPFAYGKQRREIVEFPSQSSLFASLLRKKTTQLYVSREIA